MKSYSPYLLIICFNIQFGICQVDLVGQVIDAATEEPLPYVNIGLVNQNIGTVTDEAGYFVRGTWKRLCGCYVAFLNDWI